jgi:TetR/AcrR family transcriptional regulator of autoinduction and epiphytic fitness
MGIVKPRPPSRAERTRETRLRMIECARDRFVRDGFAATTMQGIADDAGVAVQTVYYSFGTKGKLLCEVVDTTASGGQDASPGQPAWIRDMLAETDQQRVLALAVREGTGIYDRVAPLWPAVAGAVEADADVALYWHGVAARRRAGQEAMVVRLAELGPLRADLDVERAVDLVVVLFGHDVYRGLVLDAGWSEADYRAWLSSMLSEQLLGVTVT